MDFGAFVNFFGAKDGLVHISQLAPQRVHKVTDVVKEGDKVKVKLLGFDDRGKTRLSMKAVDQATGEDLEAKQKAEAPNEPRRGGRRRRITSRPPDHRQWLQGRPYGRPCGRRRRFSLWLLRERRASPHSVTSSPSAAKSRLARRGAAPRQADGARPAAAAAERSSFTRSSRTSTSAATCGTSVTP